MHQGYKKEYNQYDGNPLENSGFGLREFVAADGTTQATFRHIYRTIGTLFFLTPDQFCCLRSFDLSFSAVLSGRMSYRSVGNPTPRF